MKNKTQAGLEYLMTYGWALVLVATAIGVLIIVVGGPTQQTTCTISDPTKFTSKGTEVLFDTEGSWVSGGESDLYWEGKTILQNITGGKIKVKGFSYYVGDGYDNYVVGSDSPEYEWVDGICKYSIWIAVDEFNGESITKGGLSLATPIEVGAGNEIAMGWWIGLVAENFGGTCTGSPYERLIAHKANIIEFGMTYEDQFGFQKDLNISCSNLPASMPIT